MLRFSYGNSKMVHLAKYLGLNRMELVAFDCPAGWTCPAANICKNFSNRETGHIKKVGSVLCYAAKVEAYSPAARLLRWHNFDELSACKESDKMADLILSSIPERVKIIRVHSSGDFFNQEYFKAWYQVALNRPDLIIFGYTKILPYVLELKPDNFILQYSYGGLYDAERDSSNMNIPTCFIRVNKNEYPDIKTVCASKESGHEDYLSIIARESFAINLH